MNKYVKDFLLRGLMFAGFGPVVLGIVYAVLQQTLESFSLSGGQVLLAIVSTYVLAFVQAGASVFNQIEHWHISKSLLCHFSLLFLVYSLCYILNSWIPFKAEVLFIFFACFVIGYFVIWTAVYLSVKLASKKFNARLS